MVREVKEEVSRYYATCTVCGKEFEVGRYSTETVCVPCRQRAGEEDTRKELQFFLGSVIVDFKPAAIPEVKSLTCRTKDGRLFHLAPDCDCTGLQVNHFIDWEWV